MTRVNEHALNRDELDKVMTQEKFDEVARRVLERLSPAPPAPQRQPEPEVWEGYKDRKAAETDYPAAKVGGRWIFADGTSADVEPVPTVRHGQFLYHGFGVSPPPAGEHERLTLVRDYWKALYDAEYRAWKQYKGKVDHLAGIAMRNADPATFPFDIESAAGQLVAGARRLQQYAAKVEECDRLIRDTPEHRAQVARVAEAERLQRDRVNRLTKLVGITPYPEAGPTTGSDGKPLEVNKYALNRDDLKE